MLIRKLKESLPPANPSSSDMNGKKSFDEIYNQPDPRSYIESMQALEYVIPKNAYPVFSGLLEKYQKLTRKESIRVLDLGSSYGINAALLRFGLEISDLYQRYISAHAKSLSVFELIQHDRNYFHSQKTKNLIDVVGFDISAPALDYAKRVGLISDAVRANLEIDDVSEEQIQVIQNTDCIISSGCIGYVTETTLEKIINACAPRLPWMAHSVLRMFSLQKLTELLRKKGYEVYINPEPVPQRRFASIEEQARVIARLHDMGVDSSGFESQGWLYSWLIVAIPTRGFSYKTSKYSGKSSEVSQLSCEVPLKGFCQISHEY